MMLVRRAMRNMNRRGVAPGLIDNYVTAQLPGLVERCRRTIVWELDWMLLRPFNNQLELLIFGQVPATVPQVTAHIEDLVVRGEIPERRAGILTARAEQMFQRRHWMGLQPAVQRFGPGQREAQLAADSQNVHTREIGKQMEDSLAILLKVEVPATQVDTLGEIRLSWVQQKTMPPVEEMRVVYTDMVTWWNRSEIYNPGDKLYKKALRGLWWTIKNYKGELRLELEKRLWDECRDSAIPYSVCTQGHLARLSNVMVGFDDAFVPPVPVGEILQQKMAAISEMEVPYEKQIELAEAVLAELKVPAEEHKNWLAAF
jgi:hypothetical protein